MIYSYNWSDPRRDAEIFLVKLWNVEFFDLWNGKGYITIAYLFDRLHKTRTEDEYREILESLFCYANSITFDEFAILVAKNVNDLIRKDPSIDIPDLKKAGQRYNKVMSEAHMRRATSFWILDEKYAPDWAREFWPRFVERMETQMRTRFVDSFNELNWKGEDAEEWYGRIKEQDELLLHELDHCLRRKRYKSDFALVYEDHNGDLISAKQLSEDYPDEPIIGIYLRMFILRR